MSVRGAIATLAKGMRPSTGLLHNCRFEGLGVETYGIEAIVERFRMAPLDIAPDAHIIETALQFAVFDGGRAIFADVFDDHIARLWILGSDGFGGDEPTLAVPFDPDLAQAGGDVFFAASDHPDLAPDATHYVEALGREIATQAGGPRTRAFAIRAFGTVCDGAVLFTLFRLLPDQEEVAGFTLAAARWGEAGQDIVRDFGSEATLAASRWCPRIGA